MATKASGGLADLDAMFGFSTLTFEGVTIKLRKVLSKAQQRTLKDVAIATQRLQLSINDLLREAIELERAASRVEAENRKLAGAPDRMQPVPPRMPEEEQEARATAAEDQIEVELVRGCTAILVNAEDLHLDQWGIESLTQLFVFLKESTSKSLKDALLAAFPQSGSVA